MRVISGQWRGRKLVAPAGLDTRPTADRTRETLFSMLASRLGAFDELRVADLYAGSGALGIEALSRGAAHCTFVDNDRRAIDSIRANLATLGAENRAETLNLSATTLLRAQPFHLIIADPPYGDQAGNRVVEAVAAADWLAEGGWLAIETGRGQSVDPGAFRLEAERDTGRARLTLLRRA